MKRPNLYLTYKEKHINKGEYVDKYSKREDTIIEFNIEKLFIDEENKKAQDKSDFFWMKEKINYDFDVKPGDHLFVVVVRYTTGGSFSTTRGAWHIEGVYKNSEDAIAVKTLILEDEKNRREYNASTPIYKRSEVPMPEAKYKKLKVWEGYFESLEKVEIEFVEVI